MIEIVDYVGSTNFYDIHPTEKLVAFEQGNSLLLWDFIMDKKVKMHPHDNEIEAICFCGIQGNLIASISGGLKCQLFISEWQTLSRQHSIYLPSRHRKANVQSVLMEYIPDQFVVIEVELNAGYRLSLWQIKGDQLTLAFINELEQMNPCVGLGCFNFKQIVKLVTAEKNMIKYWTLDQNKAILTNKITIKQDIVNISINSVLNLVVVVNQNGSIYIINQQGDLVSQLKSDQHFVSSNSWESYMFIGCQSGAIIVYEVSTLNYVRTINPETDCKKCMSGVKSLKNSMNGETLCCVYSDGSFLAFDTYKSQLIGLLRGHFGRINCVTWDALNKNLLYVTSNDGSFSQLTQRGDRFQFRGVDVSQSYDKQLHNFQMQKQDQEIFKAVPKNKQKIKSICIDHYRDELYLGDSKGFLIVYSLPDLHFKKSVTLTQSLAIVDLKFSPAYQYLGIVFGSGFTIILDCENQLKPMLKLEDHLRDINMRDKICKGIRLFQSEYELAKDNSTQRNVFATRQPKSLQSQYYIPRQDKNFLSLTLFNQSSIRQHQIVKEGLVLSALALNIFRIDGQINGFDLHPSKEYIFILSNKGFVAVFKLQTGEQKCSIRVPCFSRHLSIDPSGLYFVIGNLHTVKEDVNVQLKYNHHTEAFERNPKPMVNMYEQSQVENFFAQSGKQILPCNFRVYEAGTGNLAQEVKSIFRITYVCFSQDGQYIVCGGKQGKVSIWGLSDDMLESSLEVQSGMKLNPFFWKDYPIEIDEQEIENDQEDSLDLSMIQPKNQGKKKPVVKSITSLPSNNKFKSVVDPKISLEAVQRQFKFTESQVQLISVNDPLYSDPTPQIIEQVNDPQLKLSDILQ